MDRDVAIKILKPKVLRRSPDVSERFIQEVRIASKLVHPNVVTTFDFGETPEGVTYMVMEYLDGVTVDQVIDSEGRFLESRAIDVCSQILDCLEVAHESGIVHRDLKPSNIMLVDNQKTSDFAKILDFGVAKLVDTEQPTGDLDQAPARQSTKFIGTPIYMSPEQILGDSVSAVSDLYSVGLMLYEMLTGVPPIEASQVAEVVQQHLDARPLPFRGLEMVNEPLREVIRRATARYPEDRYGSAREFAAALRGLMVEEGSLLESRAPAPQPPAQEPGDHEEPEDEAGLSDVFMGRNYIGMDFEAEDGGSGFDPLDPKSSQRRSRRDRREQSRGRRERSPRSAPRHASSDRSSAAAEKATASSTTSSLTPDGSLELDLDHVRRTDRRRQRAARRPPTAESSEPPSLFSSYGRLFGYGLGAIFSFYLSFLLITVFFIGYSVTTRVIFGLLPLVLAGIWAGFATVPSTRESFRERWFIPFSRNGVVLAIVLFGVLALTAPESMASSLRESGDWLFAEGPDTLVLQGLAHFTGRLTDGLSVLYAAIAGVLPW
jgi:serine/threonine protein kinase